jgi:hypothetical protein
MIALADSISPTDCYVHLHRNMGARIMWAIRNMEYNTENFHNFEWRNYDPDSIEWAINYETPYTTNE